MRSVSRCVICDSEKLYIYPSFTAPFIADPIWNTQPFEINLIRCRKCGFMFFNPRPTDEELSKLYADYRSEEYQKQRYRHEKWYTAEINQSIGKNSVEVMNRKANLRTILQSLMNLQNIERVLDYGGDSGQYIIDELIHAEKWVYDISNAPLLPGIKRLNNRRQQNSKI